MKCPPAGQAQSCTGLSGLGKGGSEATLAKNAACASLAPSAGRDVTKESVC